MSDDNATVENDPKIVSIVERFKKAEEAHTPVVRAPVDYSACEHKRSIIDDKLPELTCAACKAVLDPYAALREIADHYRDRDYRWERIREFEKKCAQDTAAHLWASGSRMRSWKHKPGNEPNYATRDGTYIARRDGEEWIVTWNGTPVRRAKTLAMCKTFVRNHVRANWGKEDARSVAQQAAAQRANSGDDE